LQEKSALLFTNDPTMSHSLTPFLNVCFIYLTYVLFITFTFIHYLFIPFILHM